MKGVPEEVSREHVAVCQKCPIRQMYAKMDFHIDWIDCPYVCDNDYDTWKAKEVVKDV